MRGLTRDYLWFVAILSRQFTTEVESFYLNTSVSFATRVIVVAVIFFFSFVKLNLMILAIKVKIIYARLNGIRMNKRRLYFIYLQAEVYLVSCKRI